MPREEGGETYLSGPEAMDLLGIDSPITFRTIRSKYNLQAYTMLGEGRTLFYKKTDLEKIPRIQVVSPEDDQI